MDAKKSDHDDAYVDLLGKYAVHVISLIDNKERKNNVDDIRLLFPNLHVFHAIDKNKISEQDIEHYVSAGYLTLDHLYLDDYIQRILTLQQVCIYLSHVSLWEKIVATADNDTDLHIIFEDDAIITVDFVEMLYVYLGKVPKDFDIIHMYVFPHQRICPKGTIYSTFKGQWGLNAYVFSKKGINAAVQKIKPMNSAIDEMITRIDLKSYTVIDDFIQHEVYESTNSQMPLIAAPPSAPAPTPPPQI